MELSCPIHHLATNPAVEVNLLSSNEHACLPPIPSTLLESVDPTGEDCLKSNQPNNAVPANTASGTPITSAPNVEQQVNITNVLESSKSALLTTHEEVMEIH